MKTSLRDNSIRDMKLTKIDWAQLLHEEDLIDDSTLQVIRDSLTCPYDVLRKARIKLDCVMMAAFREYFATLSVEDIFLHLYIDGSPQKRGLELYASTFDLCMFEDDGSVSISRRLFPLICIGVGSLGTYGKTFALLWMIFLVAGPSYHRMRRFFL
jgi:hypothetical protein